MAAPVIESVTPTSLELAPGESKQVVIKAYDPAGQSGTAVVQLNSPSGGTTNAEVTVRIPGPVSPGGFPQLVNLPGVQANMTNNGREFTLTLTLPAA